MLNDYILGMLYGDGYNSKLARERIKFNSDLYRDKRNANSSPKFFWES